MSEEDLLLRAKEWLQEKEEILREKERQIEILNKEKQLLLREIKPIKMWLREIQGEESDIALEESNTILKENIILRGDDLRNEVVAILEEVYPEGLYYKKILEQINNKGYIVMGKDPGLNLIAHLTKETRVEKTGKRGVYKKSDN